MKEKNYPVLLINFLVSFLIGFFLVIVILSFFLNIKASSSNSILSVLLLLFLHSIFGALMSYLIFKNKFKMKTSLCRHIFWGIFAAATALISMSLFLLSDFKYLTEASISSSVFYLMIYLICGFIYGLPSILISGVLFGVLNYKSS